MMPVDKLTLIRPTSSVLCAVTQLYIWHIKHRQTGGESGSTYVTYNVSWEVHSGVNIIRVKSQPHMQ